jgi:alpha-galactosidase
MRRAKITFIGGGSAKFVGGLVRDLFSFEELRGSRIALMDIDRRRLERSRRYVLKMIEDLGIDADVEATTDQRRALDGADYVVITIMVGGFKHYESDGSIPKKYGVLITVGDTIGPGAVMRLVRTGPVLEEVARNLRDVAPRAWVLNYTNPMAMCTWTLLDAGHERTVGLCHSVQGCYREIAQWLGIPAEEVRYTAGGINHINFYLTLTHRGRDLYPLLLKKKDALIAEDPSRRVKFELLECLGGWPCEGQHHQTEYYPWFRKNRRLAEKHYAVKTMWGYHWDQYHNTRLDRFTDEMIAGTRPLDLRRSLEFGAWMIHSMETGAPRVVYGNVRNAGLIENLPARAVVEVPCLVDSSGVTPCRAGRIPEPLAAVMAPHIAVHEMAVDGVKRRDRRRLLQAVQADPLTGAILTLPQIREMTEELFRENREYMRGWGKA